MRILSAILLWIVMITYHPIISWDWDFGDPSTGALNHSTEPNPVHRFSHAKVYTVTLTITDDTGTRASKTQYITVRK